MFDFGMVGLGVMGRNFLLNVASHGYSCIGLDNDPEKIQALQIVNKTGIVKGTTSIEEFVNSLEVPRKIMLLVPAGEIVDAVIEDLLKFVAPGDLIMDGGNSFFKDTKRRIDYLDSQGINLLGIGVSGGAEGARHGPSMMPGGNSDVYQLVRQLLEDVAARVGSEPCVAYMGMGAAGHYVKMVHNGIEYAMMQLLAESYDILRSQAGLSNLELQKVYSAWNQGRLQSYLVAISADIFAEADELAEGELIDRIQDMAKQKGTGKWTSQNAMDIGIPVPTIDSAVSMREISALKSQRATGSGLYSLELSCGQVVREELISAVEQTIWFGFLVCYAQGFSLLQAASVEEEFELSLEAIARVWRGGCIIRSRTLDDIRCVFADDPALDNILFSPRFTEHVLESQTGCRTVLESAIRAGIPTLAISSALGYFDSIRRARLPLNLVQAQRDFFGAHSYERTDRTGRFHTEWGSKFSKTE